MEIILELIRYIKAKKKYVLIPIFLALLFFGALLFFSANSAFAPFIYTLY
ncbi:DUF5989 family protein [Candidatus Pelagibacter sp.]|nr:DUF5989 family protein [Candidatus Pelagibacter sp.]